MPRPPPVTIITPRFTLAASTARFTTSAPWRAQRLAQLAIQRLDRLGTAVEARRRVVEKRDAPIAAAMMRDEALHGVALRHDAVLSRRDHARHGAQESHLGPDEAHITHDRNEGGGRVARQNPPHRSFHGGRAGEAAAPQ